MACNGDGLGVNSDGGGKDLSMVIDMAINVKGDGGAPKDFSIGNQDLKGISCGQQSCSGNQICCLQLTGGTNFSAMCVGPGQCADGGLTATCDGPEDCGGGGMGCCVNVNIAVGGMSMAGGMGGAMCKASCGAQADITVNGGFSADVQTAFCHQDVDCNGLVGDVNSDTPFVPSSQNTPFDTCCTAMQGGASLSVCIPAGLGGMASNFGFLDCPSLN